MNFLAHSLLGFGDDALVAGQIAGDFVRGRDLSALDPRVAFGVRLHRAVDARTDAHPAVAALRARFRPDLRRFAGIAIDVGLDHVIARDWPRVAVPEVVAATAGGASGRGDAVAPDLAAHARRVGAALAAAGPGLPDGARRFAPHLVRTLPSWATADGTRATLARLARRSARFAPLADTPAELERLDAALVDALDALWPALTRHVRDMLDRHDAMENRR